MTDLILRCVKCGRYSLDITCKCSGGCLSTKPGKFSPEDKYSQYRLKYKEKYEL